MATNGGTNGQPQLNGIIAQDKEKQNVAVHSFDPDATPEQKAAAAGKGRNQIESSKDDAPSGKEVAVTTGQTPALPPTITVTDADREPQPNGVAPPESLPPSQVPGALPEGAAPLIPEWYRVGWRAVGGIDEPLAEGAEKDKAILEMFIGEQYYGAWYHNAAIIFFAVFASHFLTVFHFGWGWLFIVLATCATYYTTSMTRVRRRARDDIQRELIKSRLVAEAESADWINHFLDRFWLIYEPVLSQTIVQSVDQVLSTNTPPVVDSLRLSTFTLGTKAPRIDSVRTWPRTAEDIVTMDWKFSFTPNDVSDMTPKEAAKKVNPKIVLSVRVGKGVASAAMPILLEDMSFSGLLRVRMKLMTSFPHVQVVDLSFLQKPIFDYVLKPLGGETFGFDIGVIPGLSAFIRDMVHSILGPMMYDPNVFTLNLEQLLSGAPIDTAIGVLQVTVHSARALKGVKIGGGTPDPYVSFSLNARQELARTKHKESTYNPTWNETKFLLINSLAEQLVLTVFDWNEHRKDSELGAATFDLSKLGEDAVQEGIETKVLKDGKERGELRFDLSFYPVLKPQKIDGGKEEELPDTKVGIVRLTLHQAKDLDHTKIMSGDLNPFAKVFLSSNAPPVHSTPRVKHTFNPVWESSTEFLCSDKHSSVITVKVVDDRDFLKDPMLGYLSIKLEDLLEAKKTARDWWPLSGCRSGRMRMSAEWKPLNMAGSLHGADRYVPPIGIVRLWMQKATDVKNVEAALGGKSDPYVRVLVNNITMGRTEVINNNLNPEWDQIIYIPVHSVKETMLLECMDYQNLTKDRSLGTCELKVRDLVAKSKDSKYPYASTGKKSVADPIRLDNGNVYKGHLHYVAEFVPAIALKGVSFESAGNEIQRIVDGRGSDTSSFSSSDVEREQIPEGITTSLPVAENGYDHEHEEGEERQEESTGASSPTESRESEKKGHTRNTKSIDSTRTTGTTKTAETARTSGTTATAETSETVDTVPPSPGIEMTKEELLTHQSGIIVFSVRKGRLSQKARLEVLLDDGYWPAFSTTRARSLNAEWDHVGEGFIKELDFGRVWLRLNENDEGDKDDIIAEFKCEARRFLEDAMSGPTTFTLTDEDQRKTSTIEIEARYVPVDIVLEPRESINNMGILRVDLMDGRQIRGVDRGGKSDPFVVFSLNDQKIFKSQTKKKTLSPEWNEQFAVQVPSRVGADFTLEVFDWNQIENAKSLGTGKIELADIEPFEATERIIKLSHQKHGDQGEIRIRMMFTPEIIARTRKNTSTFTSAGRAMTQIGGLPIGAGKGVVHGVSRIGTKVGGVFGKENHAKHDSIPVVNAPEDPPSGQVSGPVGSANNNNVNTVDFASTQNANGESSSPAEPGTLKVSILHAKDLSAPDGDTPKAYVTVRVGEKEHKTKHAGKTTTPEWNEAFSFPAGPSTPKLYVKLYDHNTFSKDRSLGEAEVDLWRHIQPKEDNNGADVLVELREGTGLLALRLQFDALGEPGSGGTKRSGSNASLANRSPFGSPSRFSLSRRPPSDESSK
ncbi:tricalbin [Fomitiporia mediterranea MF3/22]|uniref:tricalbin n=1 Tax=Fomitiporia mediterranea (strain MF3/22) TaxID=694068 RepID=UPI0004407AD6|nr:tricalbin [Fomitiporia mediterranea MF3/22]EJD04407.1 tricalbin [Fomitiporia mediterranea MF3/22]